MKNSKLKDHKPDKENKKVFNPPIINMLGKAPEDPQWRKITIPESLWLDDRMNHQEFSEYSRCPLNSFLDNKNLKSKSIILDLKESVS